MASAFPSFHSDTLLEFTGLFLLLSRLSMTGACALGMLWVLPLTPRMLYNGIKGTDTRFILVGSSWKVML
jgi:hypothetical protein